MEFVQSVVDCVRTHDLVGDIGTQHDVVLVLEDGGNKPWPQVQPMGKGLKKEKGNSNCFSALSKTQVQSGLVIDCLYRPQGWRDGPGWTGVDYQQEKHSRVQT